jgi:hypothetical protein
MKKILLIIGIIGGLISFSAVANEASAEFKILTKVKKVKPALGNCHMGNCSWSKPVSVHIVQQSQEQAILEVNLIGGESTDEKNSSVTWDKKPHKITIVCSRQHPSISIDGQTDELTLNPNGVAGASTSAANLYFQYCHSYIGDDAEASRKFGYNIQE